jgi:hypothetical protein
MCTTCIPGDCGGLKKISDLLELELLMVMSKHVGRWKLIPGPNRRAASALNQLYSPSSFFFFFFFSFQSRLLHLFIYCRVGTHVELREQPVGWGSFCSDGPGDKIEL